MIGPRYIMQAVKILVTVLLLIFVLRSVEPARLLHDLRNLQGGRLAILLACIWVGQFACAQRWRLFAAGLGLGGKYLRFLRIYFACMFFNIGLPSLIGGDAIKAYVISRTTGKPLRLGLASVLQDRAAGWLALISYGLAAALAYPMAWKGIPLIAVYVAVWLGAILALLFVWKGMGLYSRFVVPGVASPIQKVPALAADFHLALATMRLSRGALVQIIALSLFNSALSLLVYQQIAVSAGQSVNLIAFSALIPIVTLLIMMPVSLGGLGIREWAYIEALGMLGVPRSAALVTALTTSAVMILGNLAGVLFLHSIPKDLRRKQGQSATSLARES